MREWAVLRMAFLVGLLVLLTRVDDEQEADFCMEGGTGTEVVVVFLRLLDDWSSGCGRGGFIWMILRERVGGDGRLNGSASGIGLSVLVLAESVRLGGRPFFVSVAAIHLVWISMLEGCGLCSAANCKAGGGRERLDSDDDDVHGLSFAASSVEAAGVGGRIGEGMFLDVSLWFQTHQINLVGIVSSCRRQDVCFWI
jgi:hypothetical protein